MSGFEGVSAQTTRVEGRIAARTSSRFDMSTAVASMPQRGRNSVASARTP